MKQLPTALLVQGILRRYAMASAQGSGVGMNEAQASA